MSTTQSIEQLDDTALEDYQEALKLLKLTHEDDTFEIFVRTSVGKTVTLHNMDSDVTTDAILQAIAIKEGLDEDEISVTTSAGKPIKGGFTVSDYNLQANTTLNSSQRLLGGMGERAALIFTAGEMIQRGNVRSEIYASGGASTALKDYGRALGEHAPFWASIRKSLGMAGGNKQSAWNAWLKQNQVHVEGLICRMTQGGNCGDFSQVVHSRLVESTVGQWVYQIVMHDFMPDQYQPKDKKTGAVIKTYKYDHQLCVTYPVEVSQLSAMDKRAKVADGWDGYMVCTFQQFCNGENAYGHPMGWANLKIVAKQQADGQSLPKPQMKMITKLVGSYVDTYVKSKDFKKDKKKALRNLDQGYNFGNEFDFIAEEMVDKRTMPDIVDAMEDALNISLNAFLQEMETLTPREVGQYILSSPAARDITMSQNLGLKNLYAYMGECSDQSFYALSTHFRDDQLLYAFVETPTDTRLRFLTNVVVRGKLFRIYNNQSNNVLYSFLSNLPDEAFLAYYRSSETSRDKIFGNGPAQTRLFGLINASLAINDIQLLTSARMETWFLSSTTARDKILGSSSLKPFFLKRIGASANCVALAQHLTSAQLVTFFESAFSMAKRADVLADGTLRATLYTAFDNANDKRLTALCQKMDDNQFRAFYQSSGPRGTRVDGIETLQKWKARL